MADSTRVMRRSTFERELLPVCRNKLLSEITPSDLRVLCAGIVERGAPATAVHVGDIVKQIYAFAKLFGKRSAIPLMRRCPHRLLLSSQGSIALA